MGCCASNNVNVHSTKDDDDESSKPPNHSNNHNTNIVAVLSPPQVPPQVHEEIHIDIQNNNADFSPSEPQEPSLPLSLSKIVYGESELGESFHADYQSSTAQEGRLGLSDSDPTRKQHLMTVLGRVRSNTSDIVSSSTVETHQIFSTHELIRGFDDFGNKLLNEYAVIGQLGQG
eukprot:PhF_6_TR41184/c0_g1_i1/m.62335